MKRTQHAHNAHAHTRFVSIFEFIFFNFDRLQFVSIKYSTTYNVVGRSTTSQGASSIDMLLSKRCRQHALFACARYETAAHICDFYSAQTHFVSLVDVNTCYFVPQKQDTCILFLFFVFFCFSRCLFETGAG